MLATATTKHARVRQQERAIPDAYVDLCMRKGTRSDATSQPPGEPGVQRVTWNGLCLIVARDDGCKTNPTPAVVTTYWANGTREATATWRRTFDEEIRRRNAKKNRRHAEREVQPRHTATKKSSKKKGGKCKRCRY